MPSEFNSENNYENLSTFAIAKIKVSCFWHWC